MSTPALDALERLEQRAERQRKQYETWLLQLQQLNGDAKAQSVFQDVLHENREEQRVLAALRGLLSGKIINLRLTADNWWEATSTSGEVFQAESLHEVIRKAAQS